MSITEKFIYVAEGTCSSVNEVCDALDIVDEELIDWELVDDHIFRCEGCSWWVKVSERDDNGDCPDCSTIESCEECYGMFEVDEMVGGRICVECYEFGGDI